MLDKKTKELIAMENNTVNKNKKSGLFLSKFSRRILLR